MSHYSIGTGTELIDIKFAMKKTCVLPFLQMQPKTKQFFGRIIQTTQPNIFVPKRVEHPTLTQHTQQMVNVQKESSLVLVKQQI